MLNSSKFKGFSWIHSLKFSRESNPTEVIERHSGRVLQKMFKEQISIRLYKEAIGAVGFVFLL